MGQSALAEDGEISVKILLGAVIVLVVNRISSASVNPEIRLIRTAQTRTPLRSTFFISLPFPCCVNLLLTLAAEQECSHRRTAGTMRNGLFLITSNSRPFILNPSFLDQLQRSNLKKCHKQTLAVKLFEATV